MAKHWFHDKSPAAQKAYIAAHPTSIYAKSKAPKAPKKMAYPDKPVREGSPEWHALHANETARGLASLTSRLNKAKKELAVATKPFSKKRLQEVVRDLHNSITDIKRREKSRSKVKKTRVKPNSAK